MCGIAGFAGLAADEPDAGERLRAMCDAILHRGPDSAGYLQRPGVAMGMRRLSIIDVAGGQQPIANEDQSAFVIMNGEIYNHHELRQRLLSLGYRFRTRSDTEVLIHLYEELGHEMVKELQGMFAFAIWDDRTKELFLARDRTGIKPLSYAVRPDGIEFFSELRSLLAARADPPEIDPSSVLSYFMLGYVPEPASIFGGVRKLPPGHLLSWRLGSGPKVSRYWEPPKDQVRVSSVEEARQTLREKLDAAVRSHMESEVPLGAFLSGGLDSSTVVALMTRHAAGRVRTFSIGFREQEFDESEAARDVAAHFGCVHTAMTLTSDATELFEAAASMFDEPFGDSSALPTFLVSQLAKQAVTVSLSGDGGDELFGGYERYVKTLRQKILPLQVAKAAHRLGMSLPHGVFGRNRLMDIGRSRRGRYFSWVAEPLLPSEGGFISAALLDASLSIDSFAARFAPQFSEAEMAASMMRMDLETYLPGDILTKVDRTSMAVSLEARVPLLDNDLLEFAMRLPSELRVTTEKSKVLFRSVIKDIVPPWLLDRPKKGFAVPVGKWARGPLREHVEALRDPQGSIADYVDPKAIRRLLSEHQAGRRDHGQKLWRLVVLTRWLRALHAGDLARPPHVPPLRVA